METEPPKLRMFAQPDNHAFIFLSLNKQNACAPPWDINTFLTPEGINSIINDIGTGTHLSSDSNIVIEGVDAVSIEFSNSIVDSKYPIFSNHLVYFFAYQQYLVTVHFMVVNRYNEPNYFVTNRYEIIKPLFESIFHSIKIDNTEDSKWFESLSKVFTDNR